jgi:hypothetical protein
MIYYRFWRERWICVALLLASPAWAQPPEVIMPELRPIVALPIASEAVEKAQVPLQGIGAPMDRVGLRKGDSVTALVSHLDRGKVRQWVVFLSANPPEKTAVVKVPPEFKVYSSSGREIRIAGETSAVAIRVLGPFAEGENGGKKAKGLWSGTPVDQAFLALGLDRVCAMSIRLREVKEAGNHAVPEGFQLGFSPKPYPAEKTAFSRPVLDRLGVTEEDERAFAGSAPALMSFFQIVMQTQGLEEILKSVLDIPWTSVIANGGVVNPFFKFLGPFEEISAASWRLPEGAKCYALKFQLLLNNKPSLNCQLAVTAPRPPLLASGGIVGFAAQRPDGKGPVLLMQVVDARCAASE